MRALWLWCFMLLVVSACAAKRAPRAEEAYYDASGFDEESDDMDGRADFSRSRSAPAPARKAKSSSGARMAPPAPPPPGEPSPVAPDKPATKRMVFYEANTTLRVARLEASVDAISKTAIDMGGLVETVDGRRLVLRVPVARFREALAAIQAHGDVVDESIHAQDVTEAFQDVSLRLDTAKATRERLVELLAKAEDEQEKLQLVRQIQRLTEQIDRMQSQATTLARLASMSPITVNLQPREALANRGPSDESQAFRWMRRISPFGADLVRSGRTLRLDVPSGMVALSARGPFVAEGPDGARIWSGRLSTDVQADEQFWIEGLRDRLAEDFASAEISTVGEFAVVRFVQREDKPYTWLVAVRVSGRDLHVVEAFFADPEQTERYTPAVEDSLRAAGGAS